MCVWVLLFFVFVSRRTVRLLGHSGIYIVVGSALCQFGLSFTHTYRTFVAGVVAIVRHYACCHAIRQNVLAHSLPAPPPIPSLPISHPLSCFCTRKMIQTCIKNDVKTPFAEPINSVFSLACEFVNATMAKNKTHTPRKKGINQALMQCNDERQCQWANTCILCLYVLCHAPNAAWPSSLCEFSKIYSSIKHVIRFFPTTRFTSLWRWLSFGKFICASPRAVQIKIYICVDGRCDAMWPERRSGPWPGITSSNSIYYPE